MSETIHIGVLLRGSAVYDDTAGMTEVQVVIAPEATYVSYMYDGNIFVDIWRCMNGEVEVDECDEPDVRYNGNDPEYYLIQPLIDKILE